MNITLGSEIKHKNSSILDKLVQWPCRLNGLHVSFAIYQFLTISDSGTYYIKTRKCDGDVEVQ